MKFVRKQIGFRMKEYEYVTKGKLINKMPIAIRVDGKAFHTFTRGMEKPLDDVIRYAMQNTMLYLCSQIPNCVIGYTQSDEITIVLYNKNRNAESWFDNDIQKITSVSASLTTLAFNLNFSNMIDLLNANNVEFNPELYISRKNSALFDSRVFNIPEYEVNNMLIWRQLDARRNAISSLAQSVFSGDSRKELKNKKLEDLLAMLESKNIFFENMPDDFKLGCTAVKKIVNIDSTKSVARLKWAIDRSIPNFIEDKNYVDNFVSL